MAHPTTPIRDTGVRPDESPAVGWTDSPDGTLYGGIKIASNQLRAVSGDSWDYHATTGAVGPDCEMYATFPGLQLDAGAYIQFNLLLTPIGGASVDGYSCYLDSSGAQLNEVTNNTETPFGTPMSFVFAVGSSLWWKRTGSTHQIYTNDGSGVWTLRATETEGTHTTPGYLAVYLSDAGIRMTNFGGGTLGGGSDADADGAALMSRRRRRGLVLG